VLEMRRLRPGSEAEMVALFLRTELPAPRFRCGEIKSLTSEGPT
jgi:hypothetical protein